MFAESLSALRGVGPSRAQALAARGLLNLQDLLFLIPLRYRRRPSLREPSALPAGEAASVVGRVLGRRRGRLRRRAGGFLELALELEEARAGRRPPRLLARLYQGGWLIEHFQPGNRVLLSGRLDRHRPGMLVAEDFVVLAEGEAAAPHLRHLHPVLPRVPGVPAGVLSRLVDQALEKTNGVEDPLPADLRTRWGLLPLDQAFRAVHRPDQISAAERGGSRLLFDRFVALFLPLVQRKEEEQQQAPVVVASPRIRSRIEARFPYVFTSGQRAALETILRDLAQPHPMRRLLQGDVGAGKTAVALAAALAVVANRRQVLFLAPTEPLAHQHFEVIQHRLQGSRVEVGLLSARLPAIQRKELELRLATGKPDLVVGTHAALGDRVRFRDLALVIIDEQQRFGVRQRLRARAKGAVPHMLAMSATPIPRSLCLALLGDLDHTLIPDRPPRRAGVVTRVTDLQQACAAVRAAVTSGQKAFIVFPAIEADDMPALLREGRALVSPRGPLRAVPHTWLHGRLDLEGREAALAAFRGGGAAVLLATVMVEVGLDVPEATVMVVAGADRFGLATLHQLRGRVGRGQWPGTCFLVPSPGASPAARGRLEVLESEEDGFRIAEEDLRLRGPGDLTGVRQAGAGGPLPLAVGEDRRLFEAAYQGAVLLRRRGWWSSGDGSYYDLLGKAMTLLVERPSDAV